MRHTVERLVVKIDTVDELTKQAAVVRDFTTALKALEREAFSVDEPEQPAGAVD